MSKYGNKKVTLNGFEFDSQMECDFYRYLSNNYEELGIEKIELQPKFTLLDSFKYNGETVRAITYTLDFKVTFKDGLIYYLDVKGMKTNEFRLKEKMFKYKIRNEIHASFFCVTLHKGQWIYY